MIPIASADCLAKFSRLPKRQQRRIWRRCYYACVLRTWEAWASLLAMGLCAGGAASIGQGMFGSIGATIGAGLGGALGGLNHVFAVRAMIRPHLEEAVAACEGE